MVNFIVITHGEFGAYLIEAAEAIVGEQAQGVRSVSISPRHSIEEVRERFRAALEQLDGPDGLIVVSDMPGGTPTNVALPLIKDRARAEMVSGLCLYMLVVGFTQRRERGARELAGAMVEAAQRSAQDMKALLAAGKRG